MDDIFFNSYMFNLVGLSEIFVTKT